MVSGDAHNMNVSAQRRRDQLMQDRANAQAVGVGQHIDAPQASGPVGIPGMGADTFNALERGQISMREAQRRMAQNPPGHPHFPAVQ